MRLITAPSVGMYFVLLYAGSISGNASPQEASKDTQQPEIQAPSTPAIDFEVKIVPGKGILVRRKGTDDWMQSSKLTDPIAVGWLDETSKIYVASKAIKPPKAKHLQDPDYPESERKSAKEGRAFLHIVVDDQGKVRLPTVDSSPSPEFAKAAIEAVKKWTFEPAKLNGQPVAVLIPVEMEFRLY
jgi:periplasmic protein TonB